jgi:hypothetical protein
VDSDTQTDLAHSSTSTIATTVDEGSVLNAESVKDLVELCGKIFLGLLAAFYALGLIVVNVYLSNFGVYSLSLFRLNYITAGMWDAIFIVAPTWVTLTCVGMIIMIVPAWRRKLLGRLYTESPDHWEGTLANLVTVLIFFGCTLIFTGFIVSKAMFYLSTSYKNLIFSLITGVITGTYLFVFPLFIASVKSHGLLRLMRLFLVVLAGMLVLFAHALDFARTAYGVIPPYLGGGKPSEVELVLSVDSNTRDFLINSGLEFRNGTNITEKVKLISVSEDEYILLIENKGENPNVKFKGFSIRRDAVQGVIHENNWKE